MFEKIEFRKELAVVFVLTLVLGMIVDSLDFLAGTGRVISVNLIVTGLIAVVYPVVSGIVGGILISRKAGNKKVNMTHIGTAAAAGGVVLVLASLVQMLFLSDAQWLAEIAGLGTHGMNMFEGMSVNEFKNITIGASVLGMIFVGLINFTLGFTGAFIGKKVKI